MTKRQQTDQGNWNFVGVILTAVRDRDCERSAPGGWPRKNELIYLCLQWRTLTLRRFFRQPNFHAAGFFLSGEDGRPGQGMKDEGCGMNKSINSLVCFPAHPSPLPPLSIVPRGRGAR